MLKTSSVVPSPTDKKQKLRQGAHGSLRLCDQGMAEWSNNGDPDDYPPRWLSRDSSRDRRRSGTASGASRLMILVANYLPRLTAGMVRPTPRKRRMVSMNLATEIGFDR